MPNATGTALSTADVGDIEAWPPLIDEGIGPAIGVVGVTECINSTPNIVSTISNPVAEAAPRRRHRTCNRMLSTVSDIPPGGNMVEFALYDRWGCDYTVAAVGQLIAQQIGVLL